MENGKLIAKFEIPEYLREIEVSKKQRPKFYTWDGKTIKARGKKLLQKYIDQKYKKEIIENDGNIKPNWIKPPYMLAKVKANKVIGLFGCKSTVSNKYITIEACLLYNTPLTVAQEKKKTEYILINRETGEKIVANPTQAGKPRRMIIKGQDMYSGVLNEFTRAKMVNELKIDYAKKISGKNILSYTIFSNEYPVYIELEIIDTIRNHYDRTKKGDGIRWDVGNRAMPYMKTFVDFLVDNNVIPDDDRLHVSGEGYYFTPCERHEERKLIFRIYKI